MCIVLFPVSSVGPWLTFEIQLPQDDFHLLAWVLGSEVSCDQLSPLKDSYHLRGLPDQQCLLEGMEYDSHKYLGTQATSKLCPTTYTNFSPLR